MEGLYLEKLEKVNINKTKLMLRLHIDVSELNVESGHSCEKCGFILSDKFCEVFDSLPELENSLTDDVKLTLVYIAGYIVRNDELFDDSLIYWKKYGVFINELNRGGLQIPNDSVCQWTFFAYISFNTVASFV